MDNEDNEAASQPARPRLNPYTRALRRERIFSQLQLGASCADIAREERLSEQRVRKIVADTLKRQELDDPSDYALLQLVRLEGAHALAARRVAAGDIRAIAPYLQVLDSLDRYRRKAATKEVYDEEARRRLFDKMNRIVARLEVETRKWSKDAAAKTSPEAPETGREPDSDVTN